MLCRVLTRPVRLGILGSTKGTSLQPIIDAIGAQTLNAKIELVISNKANSGILARSRLYGIKTLHISVNNYTREEYDDVISNELAIHDVDLVLLIGYMRILSGTFFNRFQNRCINVHPSLLPEFAGGMDLEVHKAVLEAKRKVTGCTVHLVSPKVDAGTIILQKQCNVDDNDTPESLKVKVQALEGSALIEAIRIFQENQYVPYWPTESPTTTAIDYKTAGVDIDEGEKLINLIQPFCRHTKRPGASSELGGFGGIFNLSEAGYENDETLLVAGADGVGTKLEIAQIMESHNTIGVDLVAMCANDVLVCGAEPLFFLDYFATGKLDAVVGADVVKGIAEGCQQCGMALIGGETAEMPGMYPGNSYDIAGFCVGAVKRSQLLPREVAVGDTLLGLPSSGFHSNGFSLVRKCIELHGLNYQDPGPFRSEYGTLGEALLEPTKLYPKLLLPLLEKELINGMAHITGGGITENLPRVLPTQIKAVINLAAWTLSPMFNWIQHESNLDDSNMLRTFNCGIGLILVVKPSNVPEVMQYFESLGEVVHIIGSLHDRDNEQQIEYEGNLCYVN